MLTLGECEHEIVAVPVPGPPGITGAPGGSIVTHIQSTPAATWSFSTGLGRYPASILIRLDTGEVVDTDITLPDVDHIVLTFAEPTGPGQVDII